MVPSSASGVFRRGLLSNLGLHSFSRAILFVKFAVCNAWTRIRCDFRPSKRATSSRARLCGLERSAPYHSQPENQAANLGHWAAGALFLWARLRRYQSSEAIVNDQLAIVFSRVLDEAVGVIADAGVLLGIRIDD